MRKLFTVLLGLLFFFAATAQERIKMKKEHGIYTIPCSVNGINLRFIFDTGASSVCISLSEALFMFKNGYLTEDDIIGTMAAQVASGDIVEGTKIILRQVKIGNTILTNVEASIIHSLDAPLLLGQTAIQQLGSIQINGDELVILKETSQIVPEDKLKAVKRQIDNNRIEIINDEVLLLTAELGYKPVLGGLQIGWSELKRDENGVEFWMEKRIRSNEGRKVFIKKRFAEYPTSIEITPDIWEDYFYSADYVYCDCKNKTITVHMMRERNKSGKTILVYNKENPEAIKIKSGTEEEKIWNTMCLKTKLRINNLTSAKDTVVYKENELQLQMKYRQYSEIIERNIK